DENVADMARAGKAGEAIFTQDDELIRIDDDPTEANFDQHVAATTFADNKTILHSRHFWLWLYRREFLLANQVEFITTQWEERGVLLKALLKARLITLTPNKSIMYRVRRDSTARRPKSDIDADRFLENFETVAEMMVDHDGVRKDSALRYHTNFQASQFIHYMFFGFWYKTVKATLKDPTPLLNRVAD